MFDTHGYGIIICLYVDDMLIFGFSLVQVQKTKDFFFQGPSNERYGGGRCDLGIKIMRDG